MRTTDKETEGNSDETACPGPQFFNREFKPMYVLLHNICFRNGHFNPMCCGGGGESPFLLPGACSEINLVHEEFRGMSYSDSQSCVHIGTI